MALFANSLRCNGGSAAEGRPSVADTVSRQPPVTPSGQFQKDVQCAFSILAEGEAEYSSPGVTSAPEAVTQRAGGAGARRKAITTDVQVRGIAQDGAGLSKLLTCKPKVFPGSKIGRLCLRNFEKLGQRRHLLGKRNSSLFQAVANHIDLFAKIQPRRNSATKP